MLMRLSKLIITDKRFMKRFTVFIFILLTCSVSAVYAQDKSKEKKQRSAFMEKVKKFITYDVSKLDSNYISVHDHPWLVMINSYVSKTNVDIKTPPITTTPALSHALLDLIPPGEDMGRLKIDASTPYSYRLGFYLSYGKLGGGFSKALTSHNDQEFNFKFNGNQFGVDLRFHKTKKMGGKFEFENMEQIMDRVMEKFLSLSEEEMEELDAKIEALEKQAAEDEQVSQGDLQITSFICNMHYVFNHRKFSYAAAMKPKKIQLRSAGSWLLGSTIYYSQFKAVDQDLIDSFNGINRFNSFFLALGGGYGYNLVTCKKKLMFHGSIMPMLMYSLKSDAKLANSNVDEQQKQRVKAITDNYLGGNSHFTFAGVARASIVYQMNERYVAGVDGTFDIFKIGRKPRYETLARDLILHAYVGYRF